ncbi:hypothetical protein [Saccharicrinis sp. 156]|uniref:hypothetical protein n=1 Tax=Saccharicrinis sp. 156 TaxID=3417574 RepID=UPI003D34290F
MATGYIGKWHLGWDWALDNAGAKNIDNLDVRPKVNLNVAVKMTLQRMVSNIGLVFLARSIWCPMCMWRMTCRPWSPKNDGIGQ